MKEMFLKRSLDMQVVELPADPREPLKVELFVDGLSLSRILYHHQHVSVDQTLSAQKELTVKPPAPVLDDWDIDTEALKIAEEPVLGPFVYPNLPQEGEHFKVRVKHLWTPNELFLWPLEETADVEVDGETLDEALNRINANISTLPQLDSFPCGGPCLAEYSDGKYYRARLQMFCSTEPVMILVQHVDFGSDDTLPTSKLRQMPADLLQFPCRALKVKVSGFKAPSVNRYEDVLPYSPGWSIKAAVDMIDLLHGNITAAVVAQEPELTVLLYDEDGELIHLHLVKSGLAELD